MMSTEKQALVKKKSRASKHLSELVNQSYLVLHDEAKKGSFVIWAAICVPIELFKGFENVVVAVPENHSAMSAAKNAGVPLSEQAEALGYSMDICSYARIDLGTELGDASASPAGGLPRPNLLVSDTDNCSLLVKWFDVYHRLWNIPHFIIDVPFCYESQQEKDTSFIVEQFKDLILLVESMTGQKFNVEKVKQALARSSDALHAWKEYLALAAQKPSPITAFDTFAHMAPYVTMRGDPEVARHCKLLLKEAQKRSESGEYPVPDEKYRLLWDGIAPWHQMRAMKERLAKLGANIVHATYTACMGTIEGGFDQYPYEEGSDPLQYLARIQNFSVCPYGLKLRFRAMAQIIETIGIDGVVFASNRSCKVYSVMQMDLQRMISDSYNIPAILIDVDHADVRKYNEENVFVRIEALLELIEQLRKE